MGLSRGTPDQQASLGGGLADKLARLNWSVPLLLSLLAVIGTACLYSGAGGTLDPWGERHALRFMLALFVLIAVAMTPLGAWMAAAYPVYLVALALLALVPVIGTEAMGARRWLQIAGLSIQPSEVMKVGLILALARYYQWLDPARRSRPLWVAVPLTLIAAPVLLILKQPDLGTAVLLAAVGLGIMFLAGVSLAYFAGGLAAALAAVPLALPHLRDYQRRRIEIFLDPSQDALGAGYHITQSRIALGSGGLNGRGFLQGTQGRLDFLPEKHTDFVFTLFAEEWGFVGALLLLAIYLLLTLILIRMGLSCRSQFARLACGGAALALFLYAFTNMAMVSGLAPVVGVPLPFVSYGGTSMLAMAVIIAIALCAHVHRHQTPRRADIGALM